MAAPRGVAGGRDEMASEADAQRICYTICRHPHSDHPFQRIMLGPVPVSSISNQALVDDAQRQGVDVDDMLSDYHSMMDRSEWLPKRMNWKYRNVSPIQQLRQARSQRTRAQSFFDTPPRGLSVISESPEPIHNPDTVPTKTLSRSPSLTHMPKEAPSPTLRRSASLSQLPRPAAKDAPVSSPTLDLDSLLSSPRYQGWLRWTPRSLRPRAHRNAMSPLPLDDSGGSNPLSPILGQFDLTEEQRETIVERAGVSLGHRKMVGSSFLVGQKFFEHVLAHEPPDDPPRANSVLGLVPAHTDAQLSPKTTWHTPDRRREASILRKVPPKSPKPKSYVAFALPTSDTDEVEDRTRWDSARKALSDHGTVSIRQGRPSKAMVALEEEIEAERHKLRQQLLTPPQEAVSGEAPLDAVPRAHSKESNEPQVSLSDEAMQRSAPSSPDSASQHSSSESLASLPAEPLHQEEVAQTLPPLVPPATAPPSESVSVFSRFFSASSSNRRTEEASLLEVEQVPDSAELFVRHNSVPVGQGNALPRPADEVLARSDVAPVPRTVALQSHNNMVLKRDRMLVKVQVLGHVDVGSNFDELEARRYDIRSYKWDEYLVLLRPGRVELWNEARFRGRVLGDTERLKLRYVIPLRKKEVTLSLYSEIDRLLCLTMPRSDAGRGPFPFRRHGTTILLLNARASSLAADWMWLLWRELDGQPPPHVHVHVPGISMRVRVPLPPLPSVHGTAREYDALLDLPSTLPYERSYEKMTARSLMAHTQRMIEAVPQWAELVHIMQNRGLEPVLAWRSGSIYNWVSHATTPQGVPRYWDVLSGALLTSARSAPELQMLLNNHYPTEVMHPNGYALREPPAVEGFVGRLRTISGTTTRIYLTTHDAGLYLVREPQAYAPDPYMGLPVSSVEGQNRQDRIRTHVTRFAAHEIARGLHQIRQSEGFLHLRDVCAIGSVGFSVVLSTELTQYHVHMGHEPMLACSLPQVQWVSDYDGTRAPLDARLQALDAASDEADVSLKRTQRQFRLYLENGRSIVFEAASVALAKEWMVHLYMLIVYWKSRDRMDTRMLVHASHAKETASGNARQAEDHASVSLPFIWNWCRFGGCRTILLSGVLFWRTHMRRPYHRRFFLLCDGQLLAFKLISSTHSSTSRQNEGIVYRRKGAPILLRDAYVYKGDVADRMSDLKGDDTPNQRTGGHHTEELHEQLPRLFQGGFYSAESSDDCTFVVRVRVGWDPGHWHRSKSDTMQVPYLSGRESSEISFRARTRLERDLWVRMIGHEIEKVVRSDPTRDKDLCHFGRIH
ncbi:hypothetical protein MNAN1_000047 [Malassezia nana]|uniref:PH domain-containing protein n=1 Tax=Malassezia nana TaxID=180528 RepID=A0AAF0EGJ9_9BASI|nr:hypothetical protein MNAN1_000047 [Malassezia nana]